MATRAMTEPTFLILTALADQPRHGYGIVREVEKLSAGHVRLQVGTLYGALDRLVGEGLLELDREEIVQSRLRRYYRLTETGVGALQAEAERLAGNARAARSRLRVRGLRPTGAGGTA
jgi:PadR family transcriptional regulator PadR